MLHIRSCSAFDCLQLQLGHSLPHGLSWSVPLRTYSTSPLQQTSTRSWLWTALASRWQLTCSCWVHSTVTWPRWVSPTKELNRWAGTSSTQLNMWFRFPCFWIWTLTVASLLCGVLQAAYPDTQQEASTTTPPTTTSITPLRWSASRRSWKDI